MKILVVGAGGVGGYFGGRLAADGNEVVFAARGAHRAAMKTEGLRVRSALGDIHIERPALMDNPMDLGLCDVVLVTTKMWDLAEALVQLSPVLAHDTAVVPLQNGVASEEIVAEVLGPQYAVGGVAHIAAEIAEPGVIQHTGTMARLTVGELDGSGSWRLDALTGAFESAGIDHKSSTDIQRDIWTKFILLSGLAGATSFHRQAIGEVLSGAEGRTLYADLVRETAAVGRAKGVALSDNLADKIIETVKGFPPEMKSSMQLDLERGKPLELDWLNGTVVRLGRELGVATPAHGKIVEALEPHKAGAGG